MHEVLEYSVNPEDPNTYVHVTHTSGVIVAATQCLGMSLIMECLRWEGCVPTRALTTCRTILQQTAEITVHGVPLLGGTLESILVNNYGPTVSKVCSILSMYVCMCCRYYKYGIGYRVRVDRLSDSSNSHNAKVCTPLTSPSSTGQAWG